MNGSNRCQECSGGFLRGDGKCSSCFGSGTNVSLVSTEPKCLKCKGTGICQHCEGRGFIVRDREAALRRMAEELEQKLQKLKNREP